MKNKALKVLFVYNGIFVFAAGLLGPLYAIFVETIDKNILFVSISWAAFLVSTTLGMLFLRKYGDRLKEKEYLLMGGFLIRAIVWFSFPFISTIFMLVMLQILLGIGETLGSPAFDSIFAEHLDDGCHIREYTDWKLISNITGAGAIILGGIIINYFGFFPLFFMMGSLASVSFFGVLLKPRKLL
ncbi:MAG: MFS transporter [bacterium]|nr:MFS transporter [bacterium]